MTEISLADGQTVYVAEAYEELCARMESALELGADLIEVTRMTPIGNEVGRCAVALGKVVTVQEGA
jgi:hypothetical protein